MELGVAQWQSFLPGMHKIKNPILNRKAKKS